MPAEAVNYEDPDTRARLWREARTSIGYGLCVLLAAATGLYAFVLSMPQLQVRCGWWWRRVP